MSWLARSIANSLKLDDDEDEGKPEAKPQTDESSSPRGVKEDLSELTTTLSRQFWGVASFLAPPPAPRSDAAEDPDASSGIRTDFVEIGEKFRSGITRLSNNINVSEITKAASSFLQLDEDDEEEDGKRGVVGVTDDVVAFAKDLALHPETWLNFPLPEDASHDFGFTLTDAQQEHALAVERLATELAALRYELCPGYMSDSCFWMIYFVLVHPRLAKQDAELLTTPQILKAREFLAPESKKLSTVEQENFEKEYPKPVETSASRQEELSSVPSQSSDKESNKSSDTEPSLSTSGSISQEVKPVAETHDIQIDNKTEEKAVRQEVKDQTLKSGPSKVTEVKDEDDADDWLKEETEDTGVARTNATVPIEDEDDVSFSDLEDDDGDIPTTYRKSNDSSDKDSRDWVRIE